MEDAISRSYMIDQLRKNTITELIHVGDKSIMEHVLTAPALDVQPVVHAHWDGLTIGKNGAYYCSNCGFTNIYKSNYCPRCGARMDGDPHDSGQ